MRLRPARIRRERNASSLAGLRLYAAPNPAAARTVAEWRVARPCDAVLIERLALQPSAVWFTDPTADVRAAVGQVMRAAAAASSVPVLVPYAVPFRDAGGGHSAGGAPHAAAYRRWIDAFAAGIGRGEAVVILEPDSLAGADALAGGAQAERFALIEHAAGVLAEHTAAVTYLDGGHSAWQRPVVMAERLRRAGIARAHGCALNVANFRATRDEVRYRAAVEAALGEPLRCVIDTSRNGTGSAPGGDWCNPPGRGLGVRPTTGAGETGVDGFLWIKRPGESDGVCRGGPPAGTWWPEGALELAQRSRPPLR